MKRCIECGQLIDNDYDQENCPECDAPLILEEMQEECGVCGDDGTSHDTDFEDDFDPDEEFEDDDFDDDEDLEDDEDDDFDDDLDEEDDE